MRRNTGVIVYFTAWVLMALICLVLNILNLDWDLTNTINGIFLVIVQSILQGAIIEFPLQTIVTVLLAGKRNKRAPCEHLTCVINYNLLATSKSDICECLENMYLAFVGNLSPSISAVLVSATNDEELKEFELHIRDTYRAILYDDLYREGLAFANGEYDLVDPIHLSNIWITYIGVDKTMFVTDYLDDICERYTKEFMVIHRYSRVLKKCGQYQDLMLLSDGEYEAFSYCDIEHYGKHARTKGEPLFHPSEDMINIFGRKFDYTLVLDADTGLPRSGMFDILQVAAAYPERGIIQPAIKLHYTTGDTIFMYLESKRQEILKPMANAMMTLLEHSPYFGKALLQNKTYIDYVIGEKDKLVERVPVDLLSHDTFEAALLNPLYDDSVYLLESPSLNYITWNIRERRWNRGEILLGMYYWTSVFGKPMRWLQKMCQQDIFNQTKVRTQTKFDFIPAYSAQSALRQMFLKPILLFFVLLHMGVDLKYRYTPLVAVMFSVIVLPKFATCSRENYKHVVIETLVSIIQFTPEALVGCVRIVRALHANIASDVKWVPQSSVESEFRKRNPFVTCFKHLWGYSVFALVAGILVLLYAERANLILSMLVTTFMLPFYAGLTSLTLKLQKCRPKDLSQTTVHKDIVFDKIKDFETDVLDTIADGNMYHSVGLLTAPLIPEP